MDRHNEDRASDRHRLQMKTVEMILGYPVTTKSKEACILHVVDWIENGEKGKYFACANPHSLEVAMTDPVFEAAIKGADMITPDGVGILMASRILGGKILGRVTGSDIFFGLSEALNKKGKYSYFFLGCTTENLSNIKQRINRDYPNITVAGTFSPPFKPQFSDKDNRLMVKEINRAKPDVLWVGMTAPKQEKWIYRNKGKLDVKFIGPIGAVFDFYTDNLKRAHPIFHKLQLEWLYRTLREPRRLWRRTLISHPVFFLRVIHCRFTKGHTHKRT